MKIRKAKNGEWSLRCYGNYFTLGSDTQAVKIFAEMIKLKTKHKIDKQMQRDKVDVGGYSIVLVWSRSAKLFFYEIWIGDKQIGSFHFDLSDTSIHKQAKYFSYKIPDKKEVFEKIMVLFPLPDHNAMTNKNT